MSPSTIQSSSTRPVYLRSLAALLILMLSQSVPYAIAESPNAKAVSINSSPELAMLKSWLDEQVNNSRIPGGSLLICSSRAKSCSEKLLESQTQKPKSHLRSMPPVRIASITKPVSQLELSLWLQREKISLDEPISTWLPEFRDIELTSGKKATRAPNIRELYIAHWRSHRR